jgi:hypothetical protein
MSDLVREIDAEVTSAQALKRFTHEDGRVYLISQKFLEGNWGHYSFFPEYDRGMRKLIESWEHKR